MYASCGSHPCSATRVRKGHQISWDQSYNGCELPYCCWVSNLQPLQEQPLLLTPATSPRVHADEFIPASEQSEFKIYTLHIQTGRFGANRIYMLLKMSGEMLKMKLQAKGESPPTIIWESTYKTAMKSEPSATTMTNETFTRRQSVCGSHLPYVTPSAGCGLPLFRLSGKLFKTEISYKRRERAQSIFSRTSKHITVRCHEVPCPSREWWQTDFPCKDLCSWTQALNCCQRWQLRLSIRQPAWSSYHSQCEAAGPHGSMFQSHPITSWCSHSGKALITCLYLSTLCLRNE